MGIIKHYYGPAGVWNGPYDCYTIFNIGTSRFLILVAPLLLFLIFLIFLLIIKRFNFKYLTIAFLILVLLYALEFFVTPILGINLIGVPLIDSGPCY